MTPLMAPVTVLLALLMGTPSTVRLALVPAVAWVKAKVESSALGSLMVKGVVRVAGDRQELVATGIGGCGRGNAKTRCDGVDGGGQLGVGFAGSSGDGRGGCGSGRAGNGNAVGAQRFAGGDLGRGPRCAV